MNEDDLKDREASRRKALWTLAHLVPGDPGATSVIDVLNDIEAQERRDNNSAISLADLRTAVLPQPRASGYPIVIEDEIPQPWRERFLRASTGSTRVTEGPYAHDWERFLQKWESEMRHLEAHRKARATS